MAYQTGQSTYRVQKEIEAQYGEYSTDLVHRILKSKEETAKVISGISPLEPNPFHVVHEIARMRNKDPRDIYIDPYTGELKVDSTIREKIKEAQKLEKELKKRRGKG